MIYSALVYSLAVHHRQYMERVCGLFPAAELYWPENSLGMFNPPKKYRVGITNSYFGFTTVRKLRENSASRKVITLGHSMFGSHENYHLCLPHTNDDHFMMPDLWHYVLDRKVDNNVHSYAGHYMSLYHYQNPPQVPQHDEVLFMPVSGIKDIDEIHESVKNINKRVFIRLHPVTSREKPPEKWTDSSLGLSMQDYIDYAEKNKKVKILTEQDGSLVDMVDSCRFIMGTPPSSTLLESAIRSHVYKQNKRIIATNNKENIPFRYGMSVSKSPVLEDFGFVSNAVINHLCVGNSFQMIELMRVLKEIVPLPC